MASSHSALLLGALAFAAACGRGKGASADGGWASLEARPCPSGSILTYQDFGQPFFRDWCTGCHSADLAAQDRQGAPVGIDFDSLAGIRTHLDDIWSHAADQNALMPPVGSPSSEDRAWLGDWLACGTP